MNNPAKILYVHGLNGHENGNASKLVDEALSKIGISYTLDAPQFPVTNPQLMSEDVFKILRGYDIIIASSLGAFYAMQCSGDFKSLINPALPENIEKLNDPSITADTLVYLKALKDQFFNDYLDDEFDCESYFIFGDDDNLAPNSTFFESYYHSKGQAYHVKMGHKVDEVGAEKVAEIVKSIIDNPPEYIDRTETVILETAKSLGLLDEDEQKSEIPDMRRKSDEFQRFQKKQKRNRLRHK